jgi:hypothetical protein
VKKLIVTALTIGLAAALQPAAHAQFGSGIVYDPTQSVHAIRRVSTTLRHMWTEFSEF